METWERYLKFYDSLLNSLIILLFLSLKSCLTKRLLLPGHEPYQQLWYHPWSAVCIFHCAVLWAGVGSFSSWTAASFRNGWSSTDAQRFPNIPGCCIRSSTSYQALLPLRRQSSYLFQVTVN